jgi:hypothetical protein
MSGFVILNDFFTATFLQIAKPPYVTGYTTLTPAFSILNDFRLATFGMMQLKTTNEVW